MVKMLTVLVSTISNSQVFLQMQKLLTLFFSNNISVYAIFNDQSFNDTLTNGIVRGLLLGSAAGGVASVFPLLAFHSWAVVSLLRRRAAFAFRGWSVVPEPVQVIGTSWGGGGGVLTAGLLGQGCRGTRLVAALGGFCGRRRDLVGPCGVSVSGVVSGVFAGEAPWVDFPGPGRALLPIFPSFRHGGRSLLAK